jgi:DNA invertase Pin-like site-specific DNA recombinase
MVAAQCGLAAGKRLQACKSGIAHAKAKGVRMGRPHVSVDAPAVARLRSEGRSWSEVCRELGVSKGSAQRAFMSVSEAAFNASAAD